MEMQTDDFSGTLDHFEPNPHDDDTHDQPDDQSFDDRAAMQASHNNDVKRQIDELLIERRSYGTAMTNLRHSMRQVRNDDQLSEQERAEREHELRKQLRDSQSAYDLCRRKLRKLGYEPPTSRAPRVGSTALTPTAINVADLRKVIGAADTAKLLKLLAVAQTDIIVINKTQLEKTRRWLAGEKLGQSFAGIIPVLRKFFGENEPMRDALAAWLKIVEEEQR